MHSLKLFSWLCKLPMRPLRQDVYVHRQHRRRRVRRSLLFARPLLHRPPLSYVRRSLLFAQPLQHVRRRAHSRLLFARQRLTQWRRHLQRPPTQYVRQCLLHARLHSSCTLLRLRLGPARCQFPAHLQRLHPHHSLLSTHVQRVLSRLHPPHQLHRQPQFVWLQV